MRLKRVFTPLFLTLALLLSSLSPGGYQDTVSMAAETVTTGSDEALIDEFVEYFKLLAAIPRQSKHEKAISDYLKSWMEDLGYTVRQNEANDLFFDIPATPGKEGLPLVALQAHMDMVCVAEKGKVYDPQKDPIQIIVDKEKGIMTADGTSLGADDGAGVVTLMMIAKGKVESHGPLRIILTTDEDGDMTGVQAVKKEDLEGVKYLINVDSEESDSVTISSAAGGKILHTQTPQTKKSGKKIVKKIQLSGLAGGHSGLKINAGLCNGIIAMASSLKSIGKKMKYDLVSFQGGTAENAIPNKAEAVIRIDAKSQKKLTSTVKTLNNNLKKEYKETEKNLKLTVSKGKGSKKAIADKQRDKLLSYICSVPNGVFTMSKELPDLVESSSNLGIVDINKQNINIAEGYRSSSVDKLDELLQKIKTIAKKAGLSVNIIKGASAWPVKADSTLLPIIQDAYRTVSGTDIKVMAVHGGLECGTFSELMPELDMVSIGPDVLHAHSTEETLDLKTLPKFINLVRCVLEKLSSL